MLKIINKLINGFLVAFIVIFLSCGALTFMFLIVLSWIQWTSYENFEIAKQAIEESGCASSFEYSLHEDLTLEDFYFYIKTKSGRVAVIAFHENMDVDQVCQRPKGILVSQPWYSGGVQLYRIEDMSEHLKAEEVQIRDIKDVLCNMDELIDVFERNYDGKSIPVISGYERDESRRYIHIWIDRER
jgi:hypothetical protein